VKTNGGTHRGTMWVAQKLGMPIKIVSADHSFTQEYRDIKEGGVDDAVFEIPPGYKKMTMPAGMPPMKMK
jgi:outer membrane lipoprotein-sorting protein